ncbi:hypothetical protein [Streptomyces sp. A5-4]|uniref:hypothetical protein n=1 Tax=Streptomyces sp. A5-4 TaxID=3384771 RepID=UPI003DA9C887
MSTRKVKSPTCRYGVRLDDGRPDSSRTITDLDITVLAPTAEERLLPDVSRDDRHAHRSPHSRRERVLHLLQSHPQRRWSTHELAQHLGDITLGTMYRQLSRWSKDGHITKTGLGIYTAATPTPINSLA